MIVVVNYGMGNLRSVQKGFERINVSATISSDPEVIYRAGKIVLPGVGHFARAMEKLKALGLIEVLTEKVIDHKIPILGICLGMQLMTSFSEEGNVDGLGWVKASTKKFSFLEKNIKVPHMGWNNLIVKKPNQLYTGISSDNYFYFVHSYYVECIESSDILSETKYHTTFVSSFKKNNIIGCQFHPEKSHDGGLQLLKNFTEL